MQGNEREWVQSARGMQGNAGECQVNIWEWLQSARGMQGNLGERKGVCAMCQRNAGKSRRIPGEHMGVGEMSRECRRMTGTYGSACKVPAECRGMPGECMGVSAK